MGRPSVRGIITCNLIASSVIAYVYGACPRPALTASSHRAARAARRL